MARPFQRQTLDAATATGAGTIHHAKGHNTVGLFVVARNLDTANDTLTVQLEAAVEDVDEWTPILDGAGTKKGELTVTEFVDDDGDGTYAAFMYIHGVPSPRLRANITAFTDASDSGTTPNADLSVDAYILGTNRSGTGKDYKPPV